MLVSGVIAWQVSSRQATKGCWTLLRAKGGRRSSDQVAPRAAKVIEECLRGARPVLLFSHAHFLRVLASCWRGLEAQAGGLFGMDVASLSVFVRKGKVRDSALEPMVGQLSHRRIRGLGRP
jgi:broad specificity phosphatase PhoE